MNPQVLLCSSRGGRDIVSMVNKTECFFRPLDKPSPPPPLSSHHPSRPVAFFQPPLSSSVKWVTSPFPLVNRCDGREDKKNLVCISGALVSFQCVGSISPRAPRRRCCGGPPSPRPSTPTPPLPSTVREVTSNRRAISFSDHCCPEDETSSAGPSGEEHECWHARTCNTFIISLVYI